MPNVLKWSGHVLDLEQKTCVMGILNVTPDSFSDGGMYFERGRAVERGIEMVGEGADIVDIGGESTRPFSEKLSEAEEIERVVPVIEALSKEISQPVSIDTRKASVAREALRAGASMVNDVSALRYDGNMGATAAAEGVPLIVMHMKGSPEDMQVNPQYGDLIGEIISFLKESVKRAVAEGIREELIIVDPGIGFGKSFDHNLIIIRELSRFKVLKRPLLLGASSKAFIGHVLNREPGERVNGSMACVAAGIMNGASIVRVHNVKRAVETAKMIDAIMKGLPKAQ